LLKEAGAGVAEKVSIKNGETILNFGDTPAGFMIYSWRKKISQKTTEHLLNKFNHIMHLAR
jgi:hypothetical protein